jgi:ornithine decarboxylase
MLDTVTNSPDKLQTKTFVDMESLDKAILEKKNIIKNLLQPSKPDMSKYEDLFKEFDAKKIHSSVTRRKLVTELCKLNAEEQEPFYIIDLSQIVKQYLQWEKYLPRVHPFYAVKCNPDYSILRTIQYMGGHFDCASKAEIEVLLNMGVDPKTQIIFANPCKQISHIKYARDVGVSMTTVDNEAELYKIKDHWPTAGVVIRIGVDDSQSLCRFSSKFGASLETCATLIKICKELQLNLIGVSFHVGSGCYDVTSFKKAIHDAYEVFKMAEKEGFNLTLLDIGGGWPGTNDVKPTFQDIAVAIRPILDELFPEGKVKIIAEPGRYFAAASHTMVCNVFAKRHMPENVKLGEPEYLYYINDGLYGSFNCLYFDHAKITIKTVTFGKRSKKKHLCTIFGPTCDALDKIAEKVEMPELEIGDWIYVPKFGAYSTAAASAFNGFKTVKKYFVWRN